MKCKSAVSLLLAVLLALALMTVSAAAADPDPVEPPALETDPIEINPVEPEPVPVTVTFCMPDGATVIDTVTILPGETVSADRIPTETPDGLRIHGWTGADLAAPVTSDVTVSASAAYGLNRTDHVAYISGYKDYTFRPNASMTRAEAAQMLSRLMILQGQPGEAPTFTDVGAGKWYTAAVQKLSALGVIRGYKDGTFAPNGSITRAEFVTMVSRFYTLSGSANPFTDVAPGRWYTKAITAACANGWVNGYKDGTFRPNDLVTRAEAVTILNRVLGRNTDKALWQSVLSNRYSFLDVPPNKWYSAAVAEASMKHTYTTDGEQENWSGYAGPSGLPAGLHNILGIYVIADEAGLFTIQSPGLVSYGGKQYHVSAPGAAIDYVPDYGVRYADGTYCGDGTGAVVINGDFGALHFGADGRYSSGNAELDALVEELLAKSTNRSMTQSEMLRAVYVYLRDGGEYGYLGLKHQPRGSTDWVEPMALFFLQNKRGNCYCWAAAYCYAARALGYDAYAVSGGVAPGNQEHAWTMIHWWDGTDHLFDVELEWGHQHGHYRDQYVQDLYNLAPGTYPRDYIFQ